MLWQSTCVFNFPYQDSIVSETFAFVLIPIRQPPPFSRFYFFHQSNKFHLCSWELGCDTELSTPGPASVMDPVIGTPRRSPHRPDSETEPSFDPLPWVEEQMSLTRN